MSHLKSCNELGKKHQISHDPHIEKCLFCQKTKREILDEMEAFDEPEFDQSRISSEIELDNSY